MKKITFLFLLITSTIFAQSIDVKDFKVNESANRNFSSGTRFDFEFKIKGDYTYRTHGHHQIDLYVYKGNSTSSSNEIARSYWNREDDYDLNFSTYTVKNWWNTSLKSYSTHPGQVFTLKIKYAGLTKTLTYTYPNPTNTGEPELSIILNSSTIHSNCFDCSSIFSQIGSDRHFIYQNSGSANLQILVENTGNATSNATKVGIYASSNNTFEKNADSKIKSFNLNAINSGQYDDASGAIFAYETDITTNFWLIIRIDDDETNDETNENNNIFAIRFNANTPF